jgi:hypothetical protein
MSKQNQGFRKIRSQSTSCAIARAQVKSTASLSSVDDGVASSLTPAQPGFDFNAAGENASCGEFAGSAIGNRIQFANAADLDSADFGRAAVAVRKPITFARQLAAAPLRLKLASGLSLTSRAYVRFRGIIHGLAKRFLHRQARCHKLQLLEIQQLGEKRFIAMVRVGKQKFLIGGAAASVSLLAEIDSRKTTVISPRPLDQETA